MIGRNVKVWNVFKIHCFVTSIGLTYFTHTHTQHTHTTVKVSFEKFLTLPSSYLTDDYDGDEESEEETEECKM